MTVGIIGVAVGLLCFVVICYFPRYILGMDKHYPNSDRMYKIELQKWSMECQLATDIEQYLKNYHSEEIENQTITSESRTVKSVSFSDKKEVPYNFRLIEADTSLISFFSLTPVIGTHQSITKTPNSVVLYESFAKTIGNPASLIGGTIDIEDHSLRITGILKDLPVNSTLIQDNKGIIFNLNDSLLIKSKYHPVRTNPAYILLNKNANPKILEEKLNQSDILFQKEGDENSNSVKVVSINSEAENTPVIVFAIVYGIATLILLTTLFNFVSFLLTQFYNRLKEAAIRKVGGASFSQTFGLFFTEFIIALLIAFALSFLLLGIIKPILEYYLYNDKSFIPLDYQMMRIQLAQYLFIAVPIAAFLCWIPSKVIDRLGIQRVLLGISGSGKKSKVRDILLFVQMSIFLIFISVSLMFRIQMNTVYSNMMNTLTAEEKENMISATCYLDQLKGKKEILLNKIQSSPYIEDAIYSYSTFSGFSSLFDVSGISDQIMQNVSMYGVSSRFPDFFHGEMISGQFFKDDINPYLAVVDENFVASLKGDNPIGKTFTCDYGEFTIIGVMKNIQKTKGDHSLTTRTNPNFYTSMPDTEGDYLIYSKAVPGKLKEARLHVEKCLREFVPETIEIKVSTLGEDMKYRQFGGERMFSNITGIFGIIALMICLLSLYSAISLNVGRRKKEVAIRKINGAEIRDIIRLFARSYVGLLTGACILIFPVVYFIGSGWLEQFSQRISLNWVFFLSIYLFVLVLVVLTIIFRILKVANENPAEVVKSE